MRVKDFCKNLCLSLCLMAWTGCDKEEWDFAAEETAESTVITGEVRSANGEPLADVVVRVDYEEQRWLQLPNVRHKAEVKTDKKGAYRLHFLVKDDETTEEEGLSKSYHLAFDLRNLNPEVYILPGDMYDVPGDTEGDLRTIVGFSYIPAEKASTYTYDVYVPRKRMIQVTLRGFVPEAYGDYFRLTNTLPYGSGTACADKDYELRSDGYYSGKERTFSIPFALNEENVVTVERVKNGVSLTEEHTILVSDNTPASLTYDF